MMSRLHGVDVSGWDEGIDCAALTADFVIVKSTEGLQGTIYNPTYRQMADAALASGKLLGFYHYANGEDPVAEAEAFYESIRDYKGRAVACLDWEDRGNPLFCSGEDVGWCLRFLDRIAELTGGTPLFYTNKTTCNAFDWSPVAAKYPLWGAEYAYNNYTWPDYLEEPWESEDPWGAWGRDVALHQYGYVNPQPNNGGIGSLDGEICYRDRETWLSWCGEKGGGDMARIDEVLAIAESQLGVRYWSMHTGPRGSDEEGWGCAMFCAWCLNRVLGTDYYGSAYNFFGDALGDDTYNQGGGEFYLVSEPDAHAGDVVCYCPSGYTATDATDCGHVALLVSDTEVIGAMGHGVPGQSGYLNIGISRTPIYEQSLGGPVRYVRCRRLHEAKPEPTPKPEPEPTPETEEATTMFCMIHPTGDSKIYYWDGSPETVPYHVSPDEKAAIEDAYAKVNGKSLKTIEVGKAAFDKLLAMTKARKAWREQGIAAAVPKPPTTDAIAKAVGDAIGSEA